MNLDSRLLSFPLYVCCNFLYTSPQSDSRQDSSEQESTARCGSWGPSSCCHSSGNIEMLTRTVDCAQSTTIFNTTMTLDISSACSVNQQGVYRENVWYLCIQYFGSFRVNHSCHLQYNRHNMDHSGRKEIHLITTPSISGTVCSEMLDHS